MDQGWAQMEPDVSTNIRSAAEVLEEAGAVVDTIRLNFRMTGRDLRNAIENALFSTAAGGELAELPARKLTTYGKRFRKLATHMTARHAKQASEAAVCVHTELEDKVFGRGYRALLCPTVSTTALPADYDPSGDRLAVAGKRADPYVGWFQTSIFNLLNWMPVINVPAGRGRNGVPIGLQIAAGPYNDGSAFAVAAAYAARSNSLFKSGAMPAFC
jgi:Asp-tRNA(Asn)/Glu-tRNA(Gln) amidotransferase A subunit family amidase